RVFALEHLEEAVALAARYEGELRMEQLIEGDELTVSILDEMALRAIRIVPQVQWYDYNAKYLAEDTQYVCPGLDGVAEAEIAQLA
ncbi:D-alanine--D-alanine ligase, partial [Xylella fastidiosa subsp. multiplex]|nr:D-alanine--D-alanine ligase [Xylella fastidiosa subsp. multiplex]